MKKSRFTDEQIIGFLKQAEAGMPVKELCRLGGFSDATFYKWRAKFGGMQARREAVARMVEQLAISERRACRYVIVRRRPSLTACGFQASTICRSRLNATRQLCPSQSRVAVC